MNSLNPSINRTHSCLIPPAELPAATIRGTQAKDELNLSGQSTDALIDEILGISESKPPHWLENHPVMVSGFGKYHTNEFDPKQPKKRLTAYTLITLEDIRQLVDTPQILEKTKGQWVIPSSLESRYSKLQEERGQYWMLWADLDEDPKPLDEVESHLRLNSVIGEACFELYTTRSATPIMQKARILIPLKRPLSPEAWILCQEVLNDKLVASGITPDRTSERAAQPCFLPNRGEYYASRSQRSDLLFNPLDCWAADIAKKCEAIARHEEELERQSKAARKRREKSRPTDSLSPIDAFNQAYTVQEILLQAGYAQRGDKFRHPRSQSGSYSAKVLNGRVHSLSSQDPLYTNGGGIGAHDAFSAFVVLFAAGDQKAGIKLALTEWLSIKKENTNPMLACEPSRLPSEPDSSASTSPINIEPAQEIETNFSFISASQLLKSPSPVTYLIDELIEQPSLCLLFAPSGAGKSFLALSWSASIASGTPWQGKEVCAGPVFYLAGEGHAGIGRRLKAWEVHHGISLDNAPLYVSTVPAALMDSECAQGVETAISKLSLTHGKPSLIVIDTFARNMGGGDENSNADISTFVNHIDRMRAHLGATVLLVHHSGHAEKDRARGGSALNAAMDGTFHLESNAKGEITLTQRKAKESEPIEPMLFKLEPITLSGWLDAKGRDIDSAVLISRTGMLPSKEDTLSEQQREGLEAFYLALDSSGQKIGDLHIGVTTEVWRHWFYETCTANSQSSKKTAFLRVRKELLNRGILLEDNNMFMIEREKREKGLGDRASKRPEDTLT